MVIGLNEVWPMFSDFCLSNLLFCITVVIIGDKPTGLYIAYNYRFDVYSGY